MPRYSNSSLLVFEEKGEISELHPESIELSLVELPDDLDIDLPEVLPQFFLREGIILFCNRLSHMCPVTTSDDVSFCQEFQGEQGIDRYHAGVQWVYIPVVRIFNWRRQNR